MNGEPKIKFLKKRRRQILKGEKERERDHEAGRGGEGELGLTGGEESGGSGEL